MALTRVQKSGRVMGDAPVQDARVIDQFMDDVVNYLSCLTFEFDTVLLPAVEQLCINRRVSKSFAIENEQTCLQRNPIIENGVTVTIEDGGEWLIL